MRITVLGATGGTGREIVRQGLDAGYEVTAVVRDPARLAIEHDRLSVVRADVFDAAALEPAVKDADAVLSALGATSIRDDTPVCRDATRAAIAAMRAAGRRRLLVVSAVPVPRHDPGNRGLGGAIARPILRVIFRRGYADMGAMEDLVRAADDLDWTIFRPPRLLDKPATGRARTALHQNVPGGTSVSRADLAAEMLRRITDPESVRAAVGVAN